MPVYRFEKKQILPAKQSAVWSFVSNPANLKIITPPYMGFEIIGKEPDTMYPGLMICYKVRPLLGIALKWVTEITHANKPDFFVDEQRVGPYSLWHHEHHLEPVKDGVLMTDIIHYQPPMGILGAAANTFLIKPRLEKIFEYRRKVLEEIFGKTC